jgi:hypothetical protein
MIATMEDIQLSQGRLKIFIILGAFPSGNNFSLNALERRDKRLQRRQG